jgi:hypothetical protein
MTVLRREDVQAGRELGRVSVSRYSFADPHHRASDHPPSSRSVPSRCSGCPLNAGSSFARPALSPRGSRWLQGCPQKSDQFARGGHRDFGRGRVVFGQPSESTTQTRLRTVRDRTPGLALPSAREGLADAWPVLIVPGGLHEEPADPRHCRCG